MGSYSAPAGGGFKIQAQTYVGDGTASKVIAINFLPKLIIILDRNTAPELQNIYAFDGVNISTVSDSGGYTLANIAQYVPKAVTTQITSSTIDVAALATLLSTFTANVFNINLHPYTLVVIG